MEVGVNTSDISGNIHISAYHKFNPEPWSYFFAAPQRRSYQTHKPDNSSVKLKLYQPTP